MRLAGGLVEVESDGKEQVWKYWTGQDNIFSRVQSFSLGTGAGGAYELEQTGIVLADMKIEVPEPLTTTDVRRYYAFGGQKIAMSMYNTGTPEAVTLYYFLTDALGSVVSVLDSSGNVQSTQRYLPFGEVRTDVGKIDQTDLSFTGQRSLDAQGNSYAIGLVDFKFRMLDPALGRFISPDTITPGGPQGLNRYAYGYNNPLYYTDPSGHMASECSGDPGGCGGDYTAADQAHDAYVTQRDEELKCQAGYDDYCSYGEKHPAETAAFVVAGLVTAAALPEAGAVADVVKAVGWKAAAACATSTACWTLSGAGGAAVAETASQADYYVNPDGQVIPSTGYRYGAGLAFQEEVANGQLSARTNGMYFSFNNFSTQVDAKSLLQLPYSPEIVTSFDTLQIIDDIHIPSGMYGTAKWLEPITTDFPEFGIGGATQAITYSTVQISRWWWLK